MISSYRDNLINLNALIRKEVDRAVESVLESTLNPEDDERRKQDSVSKDIEMRNLRAVDDSKESDQANEAEESEEEKSPSAKEDETPEKRKDRTGGKGTADSKKAGMPKNSVLKNPSLDSLVDKLNIMRGGKSLSDPNVKSSFNQYFETLTKTEKQTLLVFLTAISQILVGKKTGSNAIDPGEVGLRIKSPEKAEIPRSEKVQTNPSGTSGVPIVVGESQDKLSLKKMIEAYRSQQ